MPRRVLLALLLSALASLAFACEDASVRETPTAAPTAVSAARDVVEVRLGTLVIQAETADTVAERAQGLSDRDFLAADAGMLFIFEEERVPGFHMQDMRFPLDFIWISGDHRVVDLTENVPHPALAGEVLSGIQPSAPVRYVLEVNAGVIEGAGVEVGADVSFHPCEEPTVVVAADSGGNLFANPSFEQGAAPWCSLGTAAWGTPFSVSEERSRDGASSALLELRSEQGGEARVYGVVQEIAPEEFPEVLSGYYYVDRWEKGTPTQYLQFVVIVWEADNMPEEVAGLASNHQMRYILSGVESQPTFISNARYVFVTRDEPREGEWVYFERNLRQDFEELWGEVPVGFDRVRILFEVRWDGRQPTDGPSAADVYFDDLYVGPAGARP